MTTLSLQGTSMPINIPMMGRANTFDSAAANDKLDLDFVPPHIIEQQKVGRPRLRAHLHSTQLTSIDSTDGIYTQCIPLFGIDSLAVSCLPLCCACCRIKTDLEWLCRKHSCMHLGSLW